MNYILILYMVVFHVFMHCTFTLTRQEWKEYRDKTNSFIFEHYACVWVHPLCCYSSPGGVHSVWVVPATPELSPSPPGDTISGYNDSTISGLPQPLCNDGSQAGYYHDTDYSKLAKIHVHLQVIRLYWYCISQFCTVVYLLFLYWNNWFCIAITCSVLQ